MSDQPKLDGPDFGLGVPIELLADGATLAGHADQKPVLVSRRGDQYFAVSAACTHYGGPLGEGFIRGDRVWCPWHHACFDLRSGEALAAPAFAPLTRWRPEVRDAAIFVTGAIAEPRRTARSVHNANHPSRIVIVGGGAAGFAASEMLRRRGYAGALTMLNADPAPPCDRPNLSKDFLAGEAPKAWIPLREPAFYAEHDIDLRLGVSVTAIDAVNREVVCADGETLAFDRLLLATGATPRTPPDWPVHSPRVFVLRTPGDAHAIIAAAAAARSAAVVGASFIGLEAAASLRARGLDVHVIAPETIPMQRVLGPVLGGFIRDLHSDHGVQFHLGSTAEAYDGRGLRLSTGCTIEADLVVLGVGVSPNTALAEAAGLKVDGGMIVDAQLRTTNPAIYGAGDIVRYRDARTGQSIRVEHWVAAQRQGQTAAVNMLGGETRHTAAPFFWSKHYHHSIHYVGHATRWDTIEIDGSPSQASSTARYFQDGRLLAAAFLGRDREALELQHEMDEAGKRAANP
ncbi:MAG: FAD-dependent oxidoreductase [Hyphomonadaceae bacterium]